MQSYKPVVLGRLAALGQTPEEVARSLYGEGFLGMPHDQECCPVGNFLKTAIALAGLPACRVIVVNESVLLYDLEDEDECIDTFDMPRPVVRMLGRFDKGFFPELDGTKA